MVLTDFVVFIHILFLGPKDLNISYFVSGNTVTTERILKQCQVRDPLTLLNFQPSNSKVGDLVKYFSFKKTEYFLYK